MSVQGEGIALGGTPIPVSTLNVTENGTYTPSAGAAYNVVNVNVEQPFSFVVKGSGSFQTSGDVNVNFPISVYFSNKITTGTVDKLADDFEFTPD